MDSKYVLIPVDSNGFELNKTSLGQDTFYIDRGFVEIPISEEISFFIENFCDVLYYAHNKVYVMNNQRYIKKLIIK